MNESCCLCECFTELYFFYWLLLVVSLAILIAVPFVFSRSWTSLAGVNWKCRAYKTLFKITHRYKTLKIRLINSWLYWSVTLLMFSANLALVKSENRLAVLILILEIIWTVSLLKSQGLIVLNIDWVPFVMKNCEILHCVRGLYDK